MQTLFKNLFNLINLLKISLLVIFTKIFRKPSVKGTLRYQKINFFTTSASLKCIIWINGLSVYGTSPPKIVQLVIRGSA